MAPISSTEAEFSIESRSRLCAIVRESIASGVLEHCPLIPPLDQQPPELSVLRATFVTLYNGTILRGCIGSLEAHRPLCQDVAENAFSAAFQDPRFSPIQPDEVEQLTIHISVLSPPEPISFQSEVDLIAQLRPGIDGLILTAGAQRGTFLPTVWDNLQDPADFLGQLKLKAGLPSDYWSETVRVERYTTESFSD